MNARLATVLVTVAVTGCGRLVGIHDFAAADGGSHADSAYDLAHDTRHDGAESGAMDVHASEAGASIDVATDNASDVSLVTDAGTDGASADGGPIDTTTADARDASPDDKACPALTWHFATASIFSNVGRGACSYDPSTLPALVAAIDEKGFDQARGCGMCLRLVPGRTDVITKYVDVLVVDRAGDNTTSPRQLNISRQAMLAIAGADTENIGLNFALVPCPTTLVSPTIHMSAQQGSSPQHLSVQIRDQALPLTNAEIQFAGAWSAMTFASHNYWTFDSLGVAPPYAFRLTNILGDTITVDDVTLTATATANGPLIDTDEQFPSCVP